MEKLYSNVGGGHFFYIIFGSEWRKVRGEGVGQARKMASENFWE